MLHPRRERRTKTQKAKRAMMQGVKEERGGAKVIHRQNRPSPPLAVPPRCRHARFWPPWWMWSAIGAPHRYVQGLTAPFSQGKTLLWSWVSCTIFVTFTRTALSRKTSHWNISPQLRLVSTTLIACDLWIMWSRHRVFLLLFVLHTHEDKIAKMLQLVEAILS